MLEEEEQEGAEEREPFDVHEDNWKTVLAFRCLQTQWEVVAGASIVYRGLKYASFPAAMVMVDAKRSERQHLYLGLRVMEAAALEAMCAAKEASDADG